MCGKKMENYAIIEIEGTKLKVCNECKKYGKVIYESEVKSPRKASKITRTINRTHAHNVGKSEVDLIPNYGKEIKKKREEMSITQKQLAKMINEKESLIHKIENEDIEPNDKLVKKLERFLKIELTTTTPKLNYTVKDDRKDSVLTLKDVINIKKK